MTTPQKFWMPLEYPFKYTSKAIAISSHEYIVFVKYDHDLRPSEIQKYDTCTNTWSLFVKFNETIQQRFPYSPWTFAWTFNPKSQIIYVLSHHRHPFSIDLSNDNKVEDITTKLLLNSQSANLLFIDDKIHYIDSARHSESSTKHVACDVDISSMEVIHEFSDIHTSADSFKEYGFVHLKSHQILLLFGGWTGTGRSEYDARKWRKLSLKSNDKDYRKWVELDDIKFPKKLSFFGFVTTMDEKYVIIMGGWIKGKMKSKKIYVFDVNKCTLNECKIECPTGGFTSCVLMHGKFDYNLLANGYIRECYRQNAFKNLDDLSVDLISSSSTHFL